MWSVKLCRRVIELSVQSTMGRAAAANHATATPNRAVRMAGSAASAKPHDCQDDRISPNIGNAIPALT